MFAALFITLLFVGCGSDEVNSFVGNQNPNNTVTTISNVKVTATPATVAVGGASTLSATATVNGIANTNVTNLANFTANNANATINNSSKQAVGGNVGSVQIGASVTINGITASTQGAADEATLTVTAAAQKTLAFVLAPHAVQTVGLQIRASDFTRYLEVETKNTDGSRDTTASGTVTLASTLTLGPTVTRPLVNGVARFPNVKFTQQGTGTLTATTTAAGFQQVVSSSLTVSQPGSANLTINNLFTNEQVAVVLIDLANGPSLNRYAFANTGTADGSGIFQTNFSNLPPGSYSIDIFPVGKTVNNVFSISQRSQAAQALTITSGAATNRTEAAGAVAQSFVPAMNSLTASPGTVSVGSSITVTPNATGSNGNRPFSAIVIGLNDGALLGGASNVLSFTQAVTDTANGDHITNLSQANYLIVGNDVASQASSLRFSNPTVVVNP